MANLRIIKYNYAPAVNSLIANAYVAQLPPSNLNTPFKTQVFRSTTTSVDITATWAAGVLVNAVALAFTNLTTTGTIRFRGYTETTDVTPTGFDITSSVCTQGGVLGVDSGVENFPYGGGVYAEKFFEGAVIKKLLITISDPTNDEGHIDIGRLICGEYWEPTVNADYGASISFNDNTKNYRTEAGDLISERKYVNKEIAFSLGFMNTTDRQNLTYIMQSNGKFNPIYMSFFSEDVDDKKNQMYRILGKQKSNLTVSQQYFNIETSSIVLEEV